MVKKTTVEYNENITENVIKMVLVVQTPHIFLTDVISTGDQYLMNE